MSEGRTRMRLGAILMGALLLAGCGNLTSGGLGDVEVIVAADSVPSGDLLSGPAAQVPPPPIQGTLAVRVQVFVRRGLARWIEVTDGVQEVELPLSGGEPITLAEKSLTAGPYSAVRTVFRRVEADVASGLEVDGIQVTGPVLVDLGAQDRLVVDRPLDLQVSEGMVAFLAVDLHTARWLRLLDRERRRVQQEDFTGALDLRRRP